MCNWINAYLQFVIFAFYMNHFMTLHGKVFAAGINIEYLSDETNGNFSASCCITEELCTANGSQFEHVVLSTDKFCSCHFGITSEISTSGVWNLLLQGQLVSTNYFYVKLKANDMTKYAVFDNQNLDYESTCSASFNKSLSFTVSFHGDMRVQIGYSIFYYTSDRKITTDMDICNFVEYDEVVTCHNEEGREKNVTKCGFDCPSECSCILGDQSIRHLCPTTGDSSFKERKIFLVYPQNVSHLHFEFKGLTAMTNDSLSAIRENLKELSIYRNRLSNLPVGVFQGLINLEELELDHNELETLQWGIFDGLSSLKKMFLFENKLGTLPVGLFRDLVSLNDLSLRHNKIERLDNGLFNGLIKLKMLYLQGNNIVYIDHGVFYNTPNLQILSLASNRLNRLSPNLFANLLNMMNLNISYNILHSIPVIAHMEMLTILSIQGNPLQQTSRKMFDAISTNVAVFVDQPEICVCFVPSVQNCSATMSKSEHLTCGRILSSTTLAVSIWIIAFCALIGNFCVLVWRILQSGDEHQVQAVLISNLAMADLLMSIYLIITASADVHYGNFFPMNAEFWRNSVICELAGAVAITSSEASVFFLTVISIDRLSRIKFPRSARKLGAKTTRLTVLCVWLTSISIGGLTCILNNLYHSWYQSSNVCIGLPLVQRPVHTQKEILFKSTYHYKKDLETMNVTEIDRFEPGMFFSIAIFLGLNLLCFLIMLFCYIDIIRLVHNAFVQKRQLNIQQQIRTTAKVAAIIVTDFICWFPIIVTGILVQVGLVTVSASIFAWTVTFILPINSALNPFLYTLATVLSNKQWKKHMESSKHISFRPKMCDKRPANAAQSVSAAVSHSASNNLGIERNYAVEENCTQHVTSL